MAFGRARVRPRRHFRGRRHVGLGRVGRSLRRRSCGVTAILRSLACKAARSL
jgi:hypothetical protein